ncbi:hypothetical protein GCM10027056_00900 [Glaciibacter psychrotolerans]
MGTAFCTADVPTGILTPERMRGADFQKPSRGVRTVGLDLATLTGRCFAYRARMMRGQAFSHSTAARLYRMPLPPRFLYETTVHVTVSEAAQSPRVIGVVGHRHAAVESSFRLVDAFTLTDPVSTWCQLAPQLGLYDLVAAADYLVSGEVVDNGRNPPLATLEQLHEGVRRYAGKRGAKKLREALPRVRMGVDSRPETWLRLLLVDAGLPEPVVNVPIYDAGERLGKPDLAYLERRMAFDYEGDGHRVSEEQFRRDIRRRERFEAANWKYMRVVADDVFTDTADFLRRVRRVLAQRPSLP